jgi:hypothetical protein
MARKNSSKPTIDVELNSHDTEEMAIKAQLDTMVARKNGVFANPDFHDKNEVSNPAALRFTGSNLERFEQMIASLEDVSTAAADVKSHICASLSWSLASAVARMTYAAATVQHPSNPRRVRDPMMAAEEIQRIERLRDERAYLLSIVSHMTSENLLPDPRIFIEGTSTVPEARATPEEIAALNKMTVKEVNARLRAGHEAQRRQQLLTQKIIDSDQPLQNAMVSAVKNAYGGYQSLEGDVDVNLIYSLFDKVADKIDLKITRNTGQMESTSRIRKQAELGAQNQLLDKIAEAIEDSLDHFQTVRETQQFEIHNVLHRQDDRQQVEVNMD